MSFLFWAIVLFVIFSLPIVAWKVSSPSALGRKGEAFVSSRLRNLGPRYLVLDNLMLPSKGNFPTTQVDHVVVSNFGIFVIETKALSGWIFGNGRQPIWTQTFPRAKYKIPNPLHQNYGHVKSVEALIKSFYPKIPVIGFVAFPTADRLFITNTNAVGHAKDVINKILSYTKEVASDEEREDVVKILKAYHVKDRTFHKLHIKNVRARKHTKELHYGAR